MSMSSPSRLAECRILGWDDGRGQHVRAEMVAALLDYVEQGVPLGGFLQSVVANDLAGAAARADLGNYRNLGAFASFVWNEMPAPSNGSHHKYDAWINAFAEKRIAAGIAANVSVPANWPPNQGEPHGPATTPE